MASVLFHLWICLGLVYAAQAVVKPTCKASLGSPSWPSALTWASLNKTVSGRLLRPPPPGAVCHPKQPTYNAAVCPALQKEWQSIFFHVDNPVSSAWNNFNNDSCLPQAGAPCSDEGYPVYVVNATTPAHVQAAVKFAGKHNVRLVVKGTGHDYLGRSIAPNSLSVWTHHMKGIEIHSSFKPKTCSTTIKTAALTLGAGSQMGEINLAASKKNLTTLSGGGSTVGVGGYLTGGGHAAISATYGLAADHVLEIELVTPTGDIVTANECQHEDLFWAMRGGGGSTFGVITSITIAAFPSVPHLTLTVLAGTTPNSPTYWSAMAYILSQLPRLSDVGISVYTFLYPNTTYEGLTLGAFEGIFSIPQLSKENTTASLITALAPIIEHINITYPGEFQYITNATAYPSFYDWWIGNNGPNFAGEDILVGSRLLDREALTANVTKLREAIIGATPVESGSQAYLVGGKGVRDVVPRGGSDAVLPAWRESLVHMVTGVGWLPYQTKSKLKQENLLTNTYVEALRELAPNTGAYINEADINEPNPHKTFWGAHYPRLLAIKRAVDPNDVLWCTPCVGNERWKVSGDALCKV